MSSPQARSIYSSGSSASSPSSSPSPTSIVPPEAGERRHRGHRRPRGHATTAPTVIGATDSPPNYTNQPFQPEQQTTTSPVERRRSGFYGIHGLNLSNTSLDSNALLDHRGQQYMKPRRSSTLGTGGLSAFGARRFPGTGFGESAAERVQAEGLPGYSQTPGRSTEIYVTTPGDSTFTGKQRGRDPSYDSGDEDSETTHLLGTKSVRGGRWTDRPSLDVPRSTPGPSTHLSPGGGNNYGGVNFPPSVPTSPKMEPTMYVDGANILGERVGGESLGQSYISHRRGGSDTIIDIGVPAQSQHPMPSSSPPTPQETTIGRLTSNLAEEDVCFPVDECLSDGQTHVVHEGRTGRRIHREWPDLSVLEEWSREEKEQRSEGIRAKKTSEPVYVGGRLRPNLRTQWHREEDEAPYRFTYFNDELPATIHAHTISELLLPGQTFKDLFRPEPRKLDSDSDLEDEHTMYNGGVSYSNSNNNNHGNGSMGNSNNNGANIKRGSSPHVAEPVGTRPTFWLDVLSPTDAEMKVLTKAFGLHPLTAEDILMQEAREKVELFRSYYLVSYKSFEQDMNSEDYLDPVNMYVVVFREGVISFHFSMTPHPANVRRRIRQLKDYITVSADWISYALIDDITDAFAPLIQSIEDEVDDIDERILQLHVSSPTSTSMWGSDKKSLSGKEKDGEEADGNMLRRVGDCRKKVMGLYRLLGNKADVIKGFAKRCNEQWEVAPRSEIGLYLGDIQDHIVTMVANLNHYEKILSRSHSNYLAQINIKMNERQEKTADVLGRLTVLGTIVLPMNIITGLWGMNVLVPGQDIENLNWFWAITAGLLCFGFLCYIIAKRVYQIV
ncbi:hypothetical protein BDZ91DRAFT_648199 [Kalaharituber pfeilii]|nr:hypothetical protein BDZ91DRAFT_648199 [Kalaharituber pfeilii]